MEQTNQAVSQAATSEGHCLCACKQVTVLSWKIVSECDFHYLEISPKIMKVLCTEAGGEWMDYIQHHKSSFHSSHAASNSNNGVLGEATSRLL